MMRLLASSLYMDVAGARLCSCNTLLPCSPPPPPAPEPIEIRELALPPVVRNTGAGSCTPLINPHGTGCIGQATGLQAGSFQPDGRHVLATVRFAGAPSSPDPRSVYSGQQLILIKTDDTSFENGDEWKCLTCRVPENHSIGLSSPKYDYPQAFSNGRQAVAGTYVIDCGEFELASEQCQPENTFIYPIRLEDTVDGTGSGAAIRELRLHPDDVHLGFNVFEYTSGRLGQNAYLGRLNFTAAPTDGMPRGPRFDLINVNQLYSPDAPQPLFAMGNKLSTNEDSITVGELRGFSGTGREVLYVGYPRESCNVDVFAADLMIGQVRRLTTHPGYVDPVQMSADDSSIVIMDTRFTNRTLFMDGLRGIPPIVDQITATACSSVRNNGQRRFFQPWLLDRYGDRGDYYGQEINSASQGVAGSGAFDDPEWNGRADPWFSPDGTKIVYWQAKTVPPACGGNTSLPCYDSLEPGGRKERVLVAHMTSRTPLKPRKAATIPDEVPWAVPYVPGARAPRRYFPPRGDYYLQGKVSGFAAVTLVDTASGTRLQTVNVTYHDYSDDGLSLLNGSQNITETIEDLTLDKLDWYSDLTRSTWDGNDSQVTSPGGFHMSIDVLRNFFEANGTLVTTVDGVEYTQPANGE